jgi:hypothetical protein
MEYLPVVLFAAIFFVLPVVGGIAFGWLWRYRRARNELPGDADTRAIRQQRR